jgi:hypothetical protein
VSGNTRTNVARTIRHIRGLGATEERTRIVAWIRERGEEMTSNVTRDILDSLATGIERGAHHS